MRTSFAELDPAIQEHLKSIGEFASLPPGEASLETLAACWLEKERAFDDRVRAMAMESVDESEDPDRGFLALTFSGSLVAAGPISNGGRRAVYLSIDRRRDVPSRVESEDALLDGPVVRGRELSFRRGPVKRSSAVYRLALLPGGDGLPGAESAPR